MKHSEDCSSLLIQQELKSVQKRTLQDIKNLRQFVQKHNNAEISLKRKVKGPDGYHLQCIHFKSKKCPYRIRFLRQREGQGSYKDSYELEDFHLEHKNHQIYDQQDKIVRTSKKKIENYRDLIVKIYLQLREEGQHSPKPTIIQKLLLIDHKIDIYDGHDDKKIQEKLKKKLDNIIRDYKEGQKRQCKKGEIKQEKIEEEPQPQQPEAEGEWEQYLNIEPQKRIKLESEYSVSDPFMAQEYRL